jgi:hypothetical protein
MIYVHSSAALACGIRATSLAAGAIETSHTKWSQGVDHGSSVGENILGL